VNLLSDSMSFGSLSVRDEDEAGTGGSAVVELGSTFEGNPSSNKSKVNYCTRCHCIIKQKY